VPHRAASRLRRPPAPGHLKCCSTSSSRGATLIPGKFHVGARSTTSDGRRRNSQQHGSCQRSMILCMPRISSELKSNSR
jgi:hypothetical protein